MTVHPEDFDVFIYTNGTAGMNRGNGGWAAIVIRATSAKTQRLSGKERGTTSHRMELMAAIKGLEAITNRKCYRVCIISDSTYVVAGMNEWVDQWIANNWRRRDGRVKRRRVAHVDLWKRLHELTLKHEVRFDHFEDFIGESEIDECQEMVRKEIKKLTPRKKQVV